MLVLTTFSKAITRVIGKFQGDPFQHPYKFSFHLFTFSYKFINCSLIIKKTCDISVLSDCNFSSIFRLAVKKHFFYCEWIIFGIITIYYHYYHLWHYYHLLPLLPSLALSPWSPTAERHAVDREIVFEYTRQRATASTFLSFLNQS